MDDNSEVVTLEVDPSPAVRGASAGNAAIEDYGKKAAAAVGRASRAWEEHGGVVVRTSDRTRGSVERLIASVEKQAQTYGKTGVERLIAQRDQLIQRLGSEEAAVRRVTAAYDEMIRTEKAAESAASAASGAASGGTGFNGRFAFFGIKDLMEGRTKYALAEAANVMSRLRGTAFAVGGAVAGVAALGLAAYEVVKGLREIREEPDKLVAAFAKLHEPLRTQADELRAVNAHLEETISRLNHQTENPLKAMLYDARTEADKLAESLTKDLDALGELLKKREVGMWHQALGAAGTSDISALVERLEKSQNTLMAQFSERIGQTKNPKEVAGVQAEYGQRLKNLYDAAQGDLQKYQGQGPGVNAIATVLKSMGGMPNVVMQDDAARQQTLRETSQTLRELMEIAQGRIAGGNLKSRKDEADAAAEADRLKGERWRDSQDAVAVHDLIETMKKQVEAANRAFEKIAEGAAKLSAQVGYQPQNATPGMGALWQNELMRFESANAARNIGTFMNPGLFRPTGPFAEQQKANQLTAENKGWMEDRLKDDQRHLTFLEKQEQLELQIAKIHTRGNERAAIEQTYELRLNYAQRIYDLEKRTAGEVVANEKRQERQQDAAIQATTEMLQLQAKQFDHLKQVSAGLYETLFTHPSQFGGRLTSTIRDAALKPVTEGLGGLTAQFLYPLFYGGARGGGINDVRLVGGAVPVHITNMPGGGGGGGTAIFSSGGYSGGGVGDFSPVGGYSPFGIPSFAGLGSLGGFGPGGTSGFAGPVALAGGGTAASGGGLFGGLLGRGGAGGGLSNRGSVTGWLSNLKENFWNEDINLAPGVTRAASTMGHLASGAPSMGLAGSLAGVLTSKGAASLYLAGGMPLAMAGLTGTARGGAGGVIESTAGGALIGAGIGTMLLPGIGTVVGAGIGAAAGFAAGIGEVIAGVESKNQEAHRLILSIYGVNIPERSGIINQIVSLSQQYGGQVSVTVRTPQARQLIELYGMSTGQKNNLFLTTPHSGSLLEQGGNLYQGPTYFNGSPYTYASSLPTLGPSSGTIPTFDPYQGGIHISMSMDQQAVTSVLNGQVTRVTTPAYVGNQAVVALQSNNSRGQMLSALLSPGTISA